MSKSKVDSVFYMAAAGAGKTTLLVNAAYEHQEGKVALITFTRQNTEEIHRKFYRRGIPANVRIVPWYTFLLQQCVRPYQGAWIQKRVTGLRWVEGRSGMCVGADGNVIASFKSTEPGYFLDKHNKAYSDKVAQLALVLNEKSGGAVVARLARAYSAIFVDEVQDMTGYDLDLLREISRHVKVTKFAGDPRQVTFTTHKEPKNKKYANGKLVDFFMEKCGWTKVDETTLAENHRCHEKICELANALYPALPASKSAARISDAHYGVFFLREDEVDSYLSTYRPMQLRDSVRTLCSADYAVGNFGDVKGRAFKHVLIYPTDPMRKWLSDHSSELKDQSRARLYVAITRAEASVAFVLTENKKKRQRKVGV